MRVMYVTRIPPMPKTKVSKCLYRVQYFVIFFIITRLFFYRYTAQAKMIETDSDNLYIVGSFKKCAEPDFKVCLTYN